MTDDLLTLMVQSGGQISGLVLKTMLQSTPAMLGLMGNIMNPLLLLPYGVMVGALPAIGTIAAAAIAVGILKQNHLGNTIGITELFAMWYKNQ